MTTSRLLASLRLAAWTAGLVVAGRLLLAAGSETLSVPVTSLDDLSVWVSDTPPADMVIAVLRLAALAAVAYLLAATVLAVAACLLRIRPLVAAAELLSPTVVRRLATGGSGIGLVLGGAMAAIPTPDLATGTAGDPVAVAASPLGHDAAPHARTATMARLPAATATMTALGAGGAANELGATPTPPPDTVAPPSTAEEPRSAEATMIRVDEAAPPAATMTRLPDPGPAPLAATPAAFTATTPTAPTRTSAPAAQAAAPGALEVDPTAWVVEPGDSLWSIAEDVVTSPDGAPPTERTVARYWQRLVAANRDSLVDPGNPDLLVPGQQLVLPSTDA